MTSVYSLKFALLSSLHLTDEETEEKKGKITCPGSPTGKWQSLDSNADSLVPEYMLTTFYISSIIGFHPSDSKTSLLETLEFTIISGIVVLELDTPMLHTKI